jgi:hypothetical protein
MCFFQVTPEVLRELDHAVSREKKDAEQAQAMQMDTQVGQHVVEDVRNLPPVPMLDDD